MYAFLLRETTLHAIESPYILPTQHLMYFGLILSIDKSILVLEKDFSPSFITKKSKAWKKMSDKFRL